MNMKTGLTGLGLFVAAGVLTISCGGTSDSGDSPTAGKGSGGSATGGSPASGGKTGSSGGTVNGGGTTPTGGTQQGPQGGGGPGPGNNGGDGPGPGNNGGDGPGPGNNGGAGNNPACPATQPTDGETCTVMTGFQGCDYDTINCRCQRMGGGQQAMRAWNCNEVGGGFGGFPNVGQGGDGSIGDVECPQAKPQDDDACTGTGFCPYQGGGCVCAQGAFNCF